MKKCCACKAEKDDASFGRDKSRKDGLATSCIECRRKYNARRSNSDEGRAYKRKWIESNRDKALAYTKSWQARVGKDRVNEVAKNWRERNPESFRENVSRWRRENPHKDRAKTRRYRASKLLAMPGWADPGAIENCYLEAERMSIETGIPHDVDHIVPLQSKLVCGLHWEGNLVVIPSSENRKKGNRQWPDMP